MQMSPADVASYSLVHDTLAGQPTALDLNGAYSLDLATGMGSAMVDLPADEGVVANAAKLVDSCTTAHDDAVTDNHVTAQHDIV